MNKDMAEQIVVTGLPQEPTVPQADEKKRNMDVEGIWKVEMMGPYEWEKLATSILQNGRYFEASANHYSAGSYEVNGEVFTMGLQLNQHGKLRTFFGEKAKQLSVQFEAKIKNKNKIVGKTIRPGRKKYDLKIRLIRLGDLN